MQLTSDPSFTFDFLTIGEAVVDFISSDLVTHLEDANRFDRFVGGQVTNLAMNLARLGHRVALGTCLGDDGFGELIREQITMAGVSSACIQISLKAPTTLIPVTRTKTGTPEFVVFRGADAHLKAVDDLIKAAAQSKILHTSAFGLSRDPTRSTIIKAMQIARENDRFKVSIKKCTPLITESNPHFDFFASA